MTGTPAIDRYRETLRRVTVAVNLAHRHIVTMPNRTPSEHVARANAMMAALRVAKMGNWRPTFPFTA